MRISSPAFRAFANGSVVGCFTYCFPSTRVIDKARIFALVFYACLVIRAVWVMFTFTFGN